MSRDLIDENYYVTSGGKIPVKWTAPEVIIVLIDDVRIIFCRHCTSESTHCTVMFGAMLVCCMRYGVWDTNLMRI